MSEADSMDVDSNFPMHLVVPELTIHILSFLSARELLNMSQTCTYYYHVCKDNSRYLWRGIVQRAWNFISDRMDVDWLKYYLERVELQREGSFRWDSVEVSGEKPSSRMCHTAVAEIGGNRLFYIGGQHGQTNRFDGVYSFDCVSLRFHAFQFKGTQRPPKFARHVSVNIGNRVYSFGGYDGVGTYFGLSVFDPAESTWVYPVTKGVEPVLRTNHAACTVGTKIYIYGGNRTEEDKTYHIYDDLHIFDTETMTWSKPITTGDIPGPRVAHKLLSVGKYVYLFGGGVWTPDRDWIEKTPYFHVLDTDTLVWTRPKTHDNHNLRVSSFPIPFVCSYFIFIFGGQANSGGGEVKDLVSFDTVSMTWFKHKTENVGWAKNGPGERSVGTACLSAGHVWLFGGSGKFNLTDTTHRLSHTIFAWNSLQQ